MLNNNKKKFSDFDNNQGPKTLLEVTIEQEAERGRRKEGFKDAMGFVCPPYGVLRLIKKGLDKL